MIFIMGMHRSATSLTGNILERLGVYLGEEGELLEGDSNNQKGYFEYKEAVRIDETIMHYNQTMWAFADKAEKSFEQICEMEMEQTIEKLISRAEGRQIAIKDPRMCVLFPLWRKVLEKRKEEVKFIVVVRNPFEVAESIYKRDGINKKYVLKIWYYYNLMILKSIKQYSSDKYLIIQNEEYFTDIEHVVNDLISFLKVDINYKTNMGGVVEEELRHNHFGKECVKKDDELSQRVISFYNYLRSFDIKNGVSDERLRYFFNVYTQIRNKSYIKEKSDIMPKAIENCREHSIKRWVDDQLTFRKDIIKSGLKKYFQNRVVTIYGNGTLAKKFLLLYDGDVMAIFDQNEGTEVIYKNKIIKTKKYCAEDKIGDLMVNTVVNHHEDIVGIVDKSSEKVVSLFSIIYDILNDKSNGERR